MSFISTSQKKLAEMYIENQKISQTRQTLVQSSNTNFNNKVLLSEVRNKILLITQLIDIPRVVPEIDLPERL